MCPKTLTTQENNSNKNATNQQFCLDARNHYPQIKHHTPPPRWSDNHPNQPGVASKPNSVPAASPPPHNRAGKNFVVAHPVAATTTRDPYTAHTPPDAGRFSWCSLERR